MLLPVLAVLIALATGIDRTWDGNLAGLAQQRANEVTVTWGHREMPELWGYNWGEVIAVNSGYTDPYALAVSQWQNSPPHWAILTTPAYHYIACAEAVTDRHYIVCLFTDRAFGSVSIVGPPIVEVIPDTALEEPGMLHFLGGFLLGLAVGWLRRRTPQPVRPFDYRDPQTWGVTLNSETGNFTFRPGTYVVRTHD